MGMNNRFDVLIVVTPDDCKRVIHLYPRLIDNFEYGKLCFIGSEGVGNLVCNDDSIKENVFWVDENEVVSFDEVHACMTEKLKPIIGDQKLPRGVTGWYYQQFLKMQYAFICKDEYYMTWDGDTVPCRRINMFSPETGQPYLDLKHEYHPEYFETMGKILPGFRKVIERSFISEHMLFRADIMRNLITEIEKNDSIPGRKFWEKIINAIEPDKIYDSAFSEFETYGTFVALRYPSVYKLREWHSFRLGASFFDMHKICNRDFEWLAKDFDAISFEKNQGIMEGNENFFDNPEYQQKLSAKKMLQLAQMEYKDGYKEVWEDDIQTASGANVTVGGFYGKAGNDNNTLIVIVSYNSKHLMEECINSIRDVLNPNTYKVVVVDNASTDGVRGWLEQQEDIILVANDKNVGFGPACNQGVRASIGTEYENADVFLLNNDTRLVFDALYFLRQALYSDENIGAVGSVSNYAGNKQQIDVTFDTVEEYIKYGEKNNVPMNNPMLERTRLSGFAMLVRRKVWDDIGGFDEDFAPGYFEDDALSMEIMKRGYRLMVVRNSFIYHAGSQSFIKTDYQKLLTEHHDLFIQKYGFDILDYACGSGTVISQIPFGPTDRFALLHYGCGLGAEIKAINSIFANCEAIGVENDPKLFEIVKKTEKVFGSLEELTEFYGEESFDVLIIDKDVAGSLDEPTAALLGSLLTSNGVIILKNKAYENFPFENIKMIIWDMDDTFWQGVISEGEVILDISNADLVKNITDHGVVNSISSRNDEKVVMEELAKAGIEDLFVFNNINWEDGGPQIADKIKTMSLAPERVLFVDNNPRNLEEAKHFAEGIMTALPDIIPYLTTYYAKNIARDTGHDKLKQYKILEKKSNAEISSESKAQFLKDSNIVVTIDRDCLNQIERITELVSQSNQLNFTKCRDTKEKLIRLITNDWNDCAYIRAGDRFGDYGIIGFYCYNTREKLVKHFLFSHRVIGMGIEQYVYNTLGCPPFETVGPVSAKLETGKSVNWITEAVEQEITEYSGKKAMVKLLIKGTYDFESIEQFIAGASITSEYAHNYGEDFALLARTGNDTTKLFDEEYHVICISMISDFIDKWSIDQVFETLDYIYDHIKGRPIIMLLLGYENSFDDSEICNATLGDSYREYNPFFTEFALDHDRMKVINVTDFIRSREDFTDSINHFSSNVYYKIAGEICRFINEMK